MLKVQETQTCLQLPGRGTAVIWSQIKYLLKEPMHWLLNSKGEITDKYNEIMCITCEKQKKEIEKV